MHQFHILLSAALLLATNGNAFPSPSPSPPAPAAAAKNSIVDLGYGKFEGVPSKSHGDVTRWLGLRYAEAPVGELRFAKPKPLEAKKTKKKGGKGKCAPGGGKDEEVKVVKADKVSSFLFFCLNIHIHTHTDTINN